MPSRHHHQHRRREPEPKPEAEARDQPADKPVARPYWSGTLSFGLVSVPVNLYPAVRSTSAGLRMLSPEGHPLQRHYYCPDDETPVGADQIVRGYEVADGEYVIVSDEELEALDPKKSRDIDLRLFVPEAEIDPVYFDRPFVLASGSESPKAYRLLAEVMEREQRAGIATFVMRDKEYLIAILSRGGILRAESLRFADELRPADGLGAGTKDAPADLLKAFSKAIDARSTSELDLDALADPDRAALRKLIADKHRRGRDVVRAPEEELSTDAEVVDLMEVLRRSLPAKPEKPARTPAEKPARKRRKQSGS